MNTEQVSERIISCIESFPKGAKLVYLSDAKKFISEISVNRKDERICFLDKDGKAESIPFKRLSVIAKELASGNPIHVQTAYKSGGNDSAKIETILANIPHVGWKKIKRKKHIVWYDYPIHPLLVPFNLDSKDWMEPEWALAVLIYEDVVLPSSYVTIPTDLAKLLDEKSTSRGTKSWQARISNINEARKPVRKDEKGFGGGPGTRERAEYWEKSYKQDPNQVKVLAAFALKPSQAATLLANRLGLSLPSADRLGGSTGIGTNLIFFGPPGTGKSHDAKIMAGTNPEPVKVLFHPEYTYNDFFGLYRPVVGSDTSSQIEAYDGGLRNKPICYFEFVAGPLLEALKQALQNPGQQTYLIIDEINRGDCAAIFGDNFHLLDRKSDGSSCYEISIRQEAAAWLDDRKVPWRSRGDKLYFPSNFTILATMNTSDQSLYPMDSAFKRRWEWQSCDLNFDALKLFLNGRPCLKDIKTTWDWITIVERLNSCILQCHLEDKQIGPWFMKPNEASGEIDSKAFANKCLYYLWDDVFKDDQMADHSPFIDKPGSVIRSFHELQKKFKDGGMASIFKEGILKDAEFVNPKASPAIEETPLPTNA